MGRLSITSDRKESDERLDGRNAQSLVHTHTHSEKKKDLFNHTDLTSRAPAIIFERIATRHDEIVPSRVQLRY